MCGRYIVTSSAAAMRAAYRFLTWIDGDVEPNYNCAPTDPMPIIRRRPRDGDDAEAGLEPAHWGLVPHWARDTKSAFRMINARAETVSTRRAFRDSFDRRRCLVPADGWYEWREENGARQPYLFEVGGTMTFAGLWAWNHSLSLLSYSIVTVAASPYAASWHDRMPALLGEHELEAWLDPELPANEAQELLRPYTGNDLSARPVSRQVGNVRNNGPELIAKQPSAPTLPL